VLAGADLDSDVRIEMQDLQLRAATINDDAFLCNLHRRTLGDVIEATWGPLGRRPAAAIPSRLVRP